MAEYKDSYREAVDIAKEAIDIAKDLKRQNDDNIRLLDSYMIANANAHLDVCNNPSHKAHWIKVREGKTYKFECSQCHTDAYCVHYDENKETVCNYKYCPNCGVKMEIDL